ncbi:hypothetical protein [Pseudosulfitobacter pseudonitzschiae]|uniref:hypothetical protein n=1 Tax=Pseudosulfitobacter pseudonitzschiae TaxID=1402135 RepID=UPI003B7F0F47
MKRAVLIALTASGLTVSGLPAFAAFYFEGLMPHTEAPNCNDPYATTCGRYGQVPHYHGDRIDEPHQNGPAADVAPNPGRKIMKPAPRYHTREGLEK